MVNKIGAVIAGGDFQGLGVLRSLGRKGIPIILLDHDHCIARYSKFKKRFFRSPHPSKANSYLNFLIDLAKKENIYGWIIIPTRDETVYVLSKYKDILEKFYKVPVSSWDIIQNVYIKEKTYLIAEKHGIPIPKTYYPKNLSELLELDLQFPVIFKPSIKPHFYNKVKKKAIAIENRKKLIKVYHWMCSIINSSEILVQELIPGVPKHLYSYSTFFKMGKVIANVTARRPRQHPMDFGHSTTFAELIYLPEIQEIAEKFLSLLDFNGIAEVEFIKDIRDNQYKLIEVNPRFWGWHTLAIRAGVDFPYLLFQDINGDPIKNSFPSNHVKWVRLLTDLPTVLMEIIKGKLSLKDYLTSMKGEKEYSVFACDDPIPFVAEILMLPYLYIKRGF